MFDSLKIIVYFSHERSKTWKVQRSVKLNSRVAATLVLKWDDIRIYMLQLAFIYCIKLLVLNIFYQLSKLLTLFHMN